MDAGEQLLSCDVRRGPSTGMPAWAAPMLHVCMLVGLACFVCDHRPSQRADPGLLRGFMSVTCPMTASRNGNASALAVIDYTLLIASGRTGVQSCTAGARCNLYF